MAVGLAAALCAKAARLSSDQMSDALDLLATSERLRDRAAALAELDAATYRLVASAKRDRTLDRRDRPRAIAEALSRASDAPVGIVEVAAGVVALAARVAEDGNSNLLGDMIAATLLAESAARAAAALVTINLAGAGDPRPKKVAELLQQIADDSARARARLVD